VQSDYTLFIWIMRVVSCYRYLICFKKFAVNRNVAILGVNLLQSLMR